MRPGQARFVGMVRFAGNSRLLRALRRITGRRGVDFKCDVSFALSGALWGRLGGRVRGVLFGLKFVETAIIGQMAGAVAFAGNGPVDAGLEVVGEFLKRGDGDEVGGDLELGLDVFIDDGVGGAGGPAGGEPSFPESVVAFHEVTNVIPACQVGSDAASGVFRMKFSRARASDCRDGDGAANSLKSTICVANCRRN